ncbi:hypothetical protein KUTeg_023291 [Tegillarca granosa]|uniref:small monomeric GTPase n=1 Tax=Tegillarca granosa TaxID=220873 RepID=A0ABQ9E661_TEGGR|nr:hypothetical protein KUTeg_023291 [Tegillarca granosa]
MYISAIVVRFLTGRYLPEYAKQEEVTYERSVTIDDKQVSIKITDIGGKGIEKKSLLKDPVQKIDGAVIVYSIEDCHSYDVAVNVVEWLRHERKSPNIIPIVVLGNKNDLEHIRTVPKQQADDQKWRNEGYLITECSASNNSDGIAEVFRMLVRKITEKGDVHSKIQKKVSHTSLGSPKMIRAHLKRRFSLFSRDRTSTM